MPQTQYVYSLQNDFPNQAVNAEALDAEIRADAAINVALEGTSVHLDEVGIVFVDALPPAEKTALDNVVANHTGLPLVDVATRAQKVAEDTTPDATWKEGLTLSANPVRGGSWQVTWNAEIAVASMINNSGVQARMRINGTERAITTSRDDQWVHFAGAGLVSLNDGDAPTIELQFQRAGVANTAKIRRCQIGLIPED